ncbi:CPBP family intramembrane glutamic endopeptidase [Latilactobacillus sakei]|uniref:CPBP family intramembrane glutamic endopeptidase n=1 Tax=Latilactobacillus sakei TaxID=1599 RepID=UPI0032F020DB
MIALGFLISVRINYRICLKKTRFNSFLKIVVSGLVFGSLHEMAINYNWLIYCAMGWILGATYYWTKDLKCSMILHALINLL